MAVPHNKFDETGLRLDKWLWYARFFKTRTLASKAISNGRFRLDGDVMSKPHRQAKCGQVLTFSQGTRIRVIRIIFSPFKVCVFEMITTCPPRSDALFWSSTESLVEIFSITSAASVHMTFLSIDPFRSHRNHAFVNIFHSIV